MRVPGRPAARLGGRLGCAGAAGGGGRCVADLRTLVRARCGYPGVSPPNEGVGRAALVRQVVVAARADLKTCLGTMWVPGRLAARRGRRLGCAGAAGGGRCACRFEESRLGPMWVPGRPVGRRRVDRPSWWEARRCRRPRRIEDSDVRAVEDIDGGSVIRCAGWVGRGWLPARCWMVL